MSIGLLALLDDISALARMAAASIDDVAGAAAKASAKAAGVVIDDTAVTPRYMTGLSPKREIPAVLRVAKGSLRNKLVFLLPACLLMSQFAPWIITPLLMIGGCYLCYEGTEKLLEAFSSDAADVLGDDYEAETKDPQQLEDERVSSAIRTDFILSAEIMTIALGSIPGQSIMAQALILAVVGIAITAGVYGAVALIIKLDDMGLALMRRANAFAFTRRLGRGMVKAMPVILSALSVIGTAAMIWVGGGIILHGLAEFGLGALPHWLEHQAAAIAQAMPFAQGFVEWAIFALGSGVFGVGIGMVAVAVIHYLVVPFVGRFRHH